MALQLTLSCDEDKKENGPTLIHSTGVQDYKIPPDVIRILQESLTNDLLSDHAEGVLCQAGPERVLDVLRQNGFSLQNQSDDEGKAVWTVVQNGSAGGGDDAEKPDNQNPTSNDDNEADAEGEDQGGDDEGEDKEGGEEEEEEEE